MNDFFRTSGMQHPIGRRLLYRVVRTLPPYCTPTREGDYPKPCESDSPAHTLCLLAFVSSIDPQVAQEYDGKVKFLKIDTDIHEEIASSLKVCEEGCGRCSIFAVMTANEPAHLEKNC